MGNVQSQYLILLDAYPVPTKTVTSSVIMTAGAFLARFVNPGPLSQVAVFAVWGFLLGPLSHVWNNVIATYGPSSLVARRVLVFMQLFSQGAAAFRSVSHCFPGLPAAQLHLPKYMVTMVMRSSLVRSPRGGRPCTQCCSTGDGATRSW